MKKTGRFTAFLLAFLMAVACAGCTASGADRLYALPRLSDEYVQLEELIAQRVKSGGEYAAPVDGRNRQSVQLHDLDGDGTEEAIAFLADENHTPNVCIYRMDEEGEYYLFVAIEGAGSAVSSVEYTDLTGDGAEELVLAWQIGEDFRLLSVYSLLREEQAQLLSADCSEYIVGDLDGDGVEELLGLNLDYGGTSTASRYTFGADGSVSQSQARLSDGITDVLRIRTGSLSDGVSALFVESAWGENELITDVLTAEGGLLNNITMSAGGRSNTLRIGGAYAADVNGDRAMEIPESAGDVLYWYALDSSGRKALELTSYHCFDGGWYLELDEPFLTGPLTVSRGSELTGESSVTFTVEGEGENTPLLAIYTLTGENRLDRAREEGRFILAEDGATVYAGQILAPDILGEEWIKTSFHLIYPEWHAGDL